MSAHTNAVLAVRAAAASAADASGNTESAEFLIQRVESPDEAIIALEWAHGNARMAFHRIEEALKAVRLYQSERAAIAAAGGAA